PVPNQLIATKSGSRSRVASQQYGSTSSNWTRRAENVSGKRNPRQATAVSDFGVSSPFSRHTAAAPTPATATATAINTAVTTIEPQKFAVPDRKLASNA